ncbi:MAG: RING finger protein, partial [Acutalibacteraceae bacterium]
MKYENLICPGCGEVFKEGDDVVVCPECGTPQHRQCYEKNGGCVNAALHEQGFVWKDERAPEIK